MNLNKLALFGMLSIPIIASATEKAVATDVTAPGSLVRMIVSLVVVVGLMILFAVVFKKLGLNRMQSSLPVKVIGAISIGSNQRIMVIEAGEEWIVLGVTPQNISTITSMPRQEVPAAVVNPVNSNFPAWMKKALENYKKP